MQTLIFQSVIKTSKSRNTGHEFRGEIMVKCRIPIWNGKTRILFSNSNDICFYKSTVCRKMFVLSEYCKISECLQLVISQSNHPKMCLILHISLIQIHNIWRSLVYTIHDDIARHIKLCKKRLSREILSLKNWLLLLAMNDTVLIKAC